MLQIFASNKHLHHSEVSHLFDNLDHILILQLVLLGSQIQHIFSEILFIVLNELIPTLSMTFGWESIVLHTKPFMFIKFLVHAKRF